MNKKFNRFTFIKICDNCLKYTLISFYSLTKEDVVMGMLKNFEMAKEDEEAQEKFKKARKLKRQVC